MKLLQELQIYKVACSGEITMCNINLSVLPVLMR